MMTLETPNKLTAEMKSRPLSLRTLRISLMVLTLSVGSIKWYSDPKHKTTSKKLSGRKYRLVEDANDL